MARLELTGVEKRYGAVEVLRDVNLRIDDGAGVEPVGATAMNPTQKLLIKFAAKYRKTERVARAKYRAAVRLGRVGQAEVYAQSMDHARRNRASNLRLAQVSE